MIGYQGIINRMIEEHDDNVLPTKINKINRIQVLQIITDEYWKEWRRLLMYGNTPTVFCSKLGNFTVRYSQLRCYLYDLINSMKFKLEFRKDQLGEGGMFTAMMNRERRRFKAAWEQADDYKKWMNNKNEKWRQKKILKYGDKAIL